MRKLFFTILLVAFVALTLGGRSSEENCGCRIKVDAIDLFNNLGNYFDNRTRVQSIANYSQAVSNIVATSTINSGIAIYRILLAFLV